MKIIFNRKEMDVADGVTLRDFLLSRSCDSSNDTKIRLYGHAQVVEKQFGLLNSGS